MRTLLHYFNTANYHCYAQRLPNQLIFESGPESTTQFLGPTESIPKWHVSRLSHAPPCDAASS